MGRRSHGARRPLSSVPVENAKALADAIQRAKPAGAKGTYVQKVSVSSTMGPGVRVDVGSLSG